MRRLLALATALAAVAGLLLLAPVRADENENPKTKLEKQYGLDRVTDRERPYLIYVPQGPRPKDGWPVVMYLHGCLQDGLNVAIGTRWLEVAKREHFIAVFPEQIVMPTQTVGCWNWFLPENQHRGSGEPAVLAGIATDVVRRHHGDADRVFVSGASAGADMVTILAATYPDVFAATAPFAGCAYATCADNSGYLAYQEMGKQARVVPSMVVQGTADPLNNPAMGETMLRQQLLTDDWADNGKPDGSVSQAPASVDRYGFDAAGLTPAGPGDPAANMCVRNQSFPCPAGVVGWKSYPYVVEHYTDAQKRVVVDMWRIVGLMHDYPGGVLQETPYRTNFVDPAGPNITEAAWTFFQAHPQQKR